MAHQDQGRIGSPCTNADDLHKVLRWLLMGVSFADLAMRGDCSWTPQTLTFAAMLWGWSDEKTLIERFQAARKITMFVGDHQQEPAGSYQAFVKVLRRWTAPLMEAILATFRVRISQQLAKLWKLRGWIVFAADGSKINVPRTRWNEARYSPQSKLSREAQKRRRKRGKKARAKALQEARARKANVPRIFLTTLWHVGTGLAWAWRAGPSDSSERGHLEEMLPTLPAGSLLTTDAGFVGYDLWKKILSAGHQLLVRVGGNVKLLKKLGFARETGGTVYLWPDKAAKKRQEPLVLRLVVASNGKSPVFLVTSVLDAKELSDEDACAIYRRRWGIELYYRHCKQTFDRSKLRSHNPDNAMVELHWSLLGMAAMGLHSHVLLAKQDIPPERMSFAGIWRAYRRPMREYKSSPDRGERLWQILNRAIIDSYRRKNKASRDYPRQKQEQPPGPPVIQNATRAQIQQAQQLKKQRK